MKHLMYIVVVLLCCTHAVAQKFDGLAVTPPMGWNSWNTFTTKINEQLVMQTADQLVASGMKDAGYVYLVLDDGWMAKKRDPKTGDLVPDPVKFPNGLEPVIAYVHSKGLKFGLYNCAGTQTCAGYPGTRGYEYQDARFYASLKIDYLKFDWCFTDGINAREAYHTMSTAIKSAGHPIVFSLCEWGYNQPWEWASGVGQLWRTTNDIGNCFDCVFDKLTWFQLGVMPIVDRNQRLRKYAGPGHWNDPDMLEVGKGVMTTAEDRTHFSLWCMMAAPLMAGNDLRSMSRETIDILTNQEAIAIDQDSLGIQGFIQSNKDSLAVWYKPLKNGDWAVCFANRSAQVKAFNYQWLPVTDTLSRLSFQPDKSSYEIRNVWTHQQQGDTRKPLAISISAHDAVMLRLTRKQ